MCVLVLVAGVRRLAVLDRRELQSYRFSRAENSLTPESGSFTGINARGEKEEAEINGNGHLLIFVIHRERLASDVQFWNAVIRLVSLNRQVPGASVQYWGVCNAGAECNSYQPDANFSILGYLDPWEMHIVAQADSKDEVLLYKRYDMLQAHVASVSDPSVEANLVAQEAKTK